MNATSDYEWDERKNIANIKKHGLSFEQAIEIFDHFYISLFDKEHSSESEMRFMHIGVLGNVCTVLSVITTERNDRVRLISARKATSKERKLYEKHLKGQFR